jgi:hypothetical protein
MNHTCHAHGCKKLVPPKMLMCLKHWRMVPKFAQDDIWRTYRPGQEIVKNPSNDYLKAQQAAVILVLLKEMNLPEDQAGLEKAALIAFPHLGKT